MDKTAQLIGYTINMVHEYNNKLNKTAITHKNKTQFEFNKKRSTKNQFAIDWYE